MDNMSAFLTVVAAVSVAVERIVEILKGSLSSVFPFRWLFTAKTDSAAESVRCAVLHFVAAICGTLVAYACRVDIWHKLDTFQVPGHAAQWYYWWGSYAFTGLLSSGGSAIWNHSLDILKATKIKQEQGAKALTANNIAQSATAVAAKTSALGVVPAVAIPDPNAVII
jgi:hypothetical protein